MVFIAIALYNYSSCGNVLILYIFMTLQCLDIDECSAVHPVCDPVRATGCINTDGDYRCHCKRGYHLSGDNHSCEGNTYDYEHNL